MVNKILEYCFLEKLKNLTFVDEIWLFGSRARGDHSARADIDLAIVCAKISRDEWLQVLEIIENADTLLKIDCVQFDAEKVNLPLYQNILKDKKVLYEKKRH